MDFHALGQQAAQSDSVARPVVAGRVLQADADFFCYECAFLDESVASNWRQLLQHIEVKRVMAGAETVNVHLTLGMKSGRDQMATVKPYQEQRDPNLPIKVRVRELRTMLANHTTDIIKPVASNIEEADDTMSQYQLAQIEKHGRNSSVIMSGDKDLWMVEGLHCDPKSGAMYNVEGYGVTTYKDVGNVKPKLVGRGTSWFWHQMLMGDTADNIPGLPKLSGRLANLYLPTKKYNPQRKALPCGEAKAVAILKDVTSDSLAAKRVYEAYVEHYQSNSAEMFVEQAFLLWMRRTNKLTDVLTYLKECGLVLEFTEAQKDRLREYTKLARVAVEERNAISNTN